MVTSRSNGKKSGLEDQIDDYSVELEASAIGSEPELTFDWIEHHIAESGYASNFRKFRKNCEQADEYYKGDFEYPAPENATLIRLGTAQSIVDTVTVHITPQFLDISVPPPSSRGQARAELLERFLRGANHMLEQDYPTRRIINQHMALYGVAWEKVEFATAKWGDFPEPPEEGEMSPEYKEQLDDILTRRSTCFPIISTAINPQQVVWDVNNGTQPRWVIHEYEVDSTWVKAHFPQWEGKGGDDKVTFIEAWTETQVAYIADRRWALKPRTHGYTSLPWTMYYPQTGVATIGNKPEDLYRGILHGNFDMLAAESRLASQYLDIITKSPHPTRDFRGPPVITEQGMSQYDNSPGALNWLHTDVQLEVSQVAEPSQTIVAGKGMLSEAIEQNTAPAIVRGQRPTGAASGYMTAVLAGIAALNFGPLVEASQRGLQTRNKIILEIVENVIQDKVTVWGKTEAGILDAKIGPKDIRGHHVNVVQLNPTSPEESERKLNLWSNLWRSGFVDQDTALRKAGVSNALEVRSKLLAEQFMNSEQVQMILQQQAAQRVPLIANILEAAQGGMGGNDQAAQIAQNILNTQTAQQLPNPGNFSAANQPAGAAAGLGAEQARVEPSTRPVMPGSIGEQDLVARQITSPARTGPRRVPTSDLPAGLR